MCSSVVVFYLPSVRVLELPEAGHITVSKMDLVERELKVRVKVDGVAVCLQCPRRVERASRGETLCHFSI